MQNMAIAMRFSRAGKQAFLNFVSPAVNGSKAKPQGLTGYQYFRLKKPGKRTRHGNKK
jgi:hypothetical protein